MKSKSIKIHFTDFFNIEPAVLEEYGAFNVSLVNDLPLFIDPFLIFNSSDPSYQQLHNDIIRYLRFLKEKSLKGQINSGLLKAWFRFGEVKQNWLGYSKVGNGGTGLGGDFASALYANLGTIFANFGDENVTKGSHLEKLCLIDEGVGKDNISDFTTNLIKEYLLDYTQIFAINHIEPKLRRKFVVEKVRFNYNTETWERGNYELPLYGNSYIILTPKDILSKDDIWISREGLYDDFHMIADSIPNDQLRSQINNYFYSLLSPNPQEKEVQKAIGRTIIEYPQIIEYYIRSKEDSGDDAVSISEQNVLETETLFVNQVDNFVQLLVNNTKFYDLIGDTYNESYERILFLKDVIENKDGYRLFYIDGKPIKREKTLQLLYRLTWFATPSDVNREVNNGRGPVDFKISRGSKDKTLVEFKLASNSKLKRNLENQVAIYERASDTNRSIKVILFMSSGEKAKVDGILRELKLNDDKNVILIDGRNDNKPSASNA